MAADKLKDPGNFLEAAVKISHTSPDIPADVQLSMKDHLLRRTRISRQTTEPASSNRSVFWKNEEMFVSQDLLIGHSVYCIYKAIMRLVLVIPNHVNTSEIS